VSSARRDELADVTGASTLEAPGRQGERDDRDGVVDVGADVGRHHDHDALARDAEIPAGRHGAFAGLSTDSWRPEDESIAQAVPVDPAVTLAVAPAATDTLLRADFSDVWQAIDPGLDKYARAD
jgi:hypothetical protein